MNPAPLLAQFDRLSEAPGAIPRLRRFILDLAVRGKLVEQDPADKPALELSRTPELRPPEVRSDLPSHWVKGKVGILLRFQYGKSLPASQRLDGGRVSVFGSNGAVGYCCESLTERSAIIIGRKGSAGALNLCEGPSWTTDVAYYVEPPPFFNIHFLFIVLQTLDLGTLGKGVKPGLSRSDAYELEIAVPPFAEQRRIVAKVNELMALCDRLEAAQSERDRRRDRLVAASLHRLNQPTDAPSLHDRARFHLSHLPRLITRPEHVQQFRQTILNLAVSGQLVPQDPNDEPSSELLRRIETEKERRIEAGQIKKQEKLPDVRDGEKWFEDPPSWRWVRLATIAQVVMGQSPPGETYNKAGKGIPLINGPVEFTAGPFGETIINQYTTAPTNVCEAGDLLICVRGSTTGRTNVAGFRACIGRGVAAIRPIIADWYVRLFIWRLRESIISMGRGIAFPSVTRQQIEELPVPLPPLAEQNRIVAKVDELMALCDRLEAQIATAKAESCRLLEAILQQALNGASE